MLQKLTKSMSHNLMTLKRMGSRYPSRLSFSRSMLRTMLKEQWQISRIKFNLDHQGYGNAIYEVSTPKQSYSLICFSKHIDDNERNDRVIADTWDTAYALHIGKISIDDIERLKKNIPLQEAGRNSSKELVLTRANKSVRLFEKVVECLANGLQPEIKEINNVGYLLRTTAVYGSGKFGLADFERVKTITHFNQPFRAEMLSLYIIREFSIQLVEHIAYHRNPSRAVKLKKEIKQHIGIGNATGLGMAPFVIKHPKLIHQWVNQFEKTLDIIKKNTHIKKDKIEKYISLLLKSQTYLSEVLTTDKLQKKKNNQSYEELSKIIDYCKNTSLENFNWSQLINYAENNVSFDTQEILKVQIIELYPDIADPLAEDMSISEDLAIATDSKVLDLVKLIQKNYDWAIATDFNGGAVRDNPQINQMISATTAKGRVGEADDIGKAIAMLLTEKSAWITGQRIEASGGMFL